MFPNGGLLRHSMPFTHTLEDKILHVTWFGVISREDLKAFGEAMPGLMQSLDFCPHILHTFDEVEGYDFQPIVVYTFSLLRKRVTIPTPVRSAALVRATHPERQKEVAALAKLFKAMNRTRNLTIEVFDDETEAREWLNDGD